MLDELVTSGKVRYVGEIIGVLFTLFTAADKVSTKPIPREDLLKGFLCHGEASGEPLASGGPLRLAHPDGVAVQCGPCGSDTPADLKNVVRLELLP